VHSIESSPSIKELASQLNGDLEKLSRTVQDLEKWFEQLNSDGYKRRLPWTDAMQRAFKRYKGLVDKHTRAHQAFENYFLTTKGSNSKKNATAEDHVERAQLALEWGRAALKYAFFFPHMFREWKTNSDCSSSLERERPGQISWRCTVRPTS